MPRGGFDELPAAPAAGDRVHALGRAELSAEEGRVRLPVIEHRALGLGMLLRRIEELRAQARRPRACSPPSASGRCRSCRATIGLVCGTRRRRQARRDRDGDGALPAGAVPRSSRRLVQGASAPRRRSRGAAPSSTPTLTVDVIVLARGGGSVEDLLPFSDETRLPGGRRCATPVVSAIGHEQDTPLVDLVADVRAGTPSLAATLIVPDHAAVAAELDALLARGGRALEGGCGRARERLSAAGRAAGVRRPRAAGSQRGAALLLARSALRRWPPLRLERERTRARGTPATGCACWARRPRSSAAMRSCRTTTARWSATPLRSAVGEHGRRCGWPRAGWPRARRGGERHERRARRFEQARDELEQIVRRLEDGRTSLDEALALWERGEQLHALCRARLDQAEQRVGELVAHGRTPP